MMKQKCFELKCWRLFHTTTSVILAHFSHHQHTFYWLCKVPLQRSRIVSLIFSFLIIIIIIIVKPFSAENFLSPTKIGPQNGGFSQKWGSKYYFFIFKTPKRHILAWDRVFWRILREDQFWGLGCSLFEEPKKTFRCYISRFHAYGEKKSLVRSAQNFALGRYPERNHRYKFGGRSV